MILYTCPKCNSEVKEEELGHICNGVRVLYVRKHKKTKQDTQEGYTKKFGSRATK